ncbi:2-C-methyl-D-erythritol 4-phosphate cytidylyltransferase [Caldanaerobacter sp.]|uniref:2-C-methyl-D-erythritol 4-phosphate cytidylyltransferase n=1 Tax=Caldanaerobacter sp. TaxID=2930036 RepID=UPI003C7233EE
MKVSAIVLAAGKSTRMNKGLNKVYLTIAGKPVVYYSIKTFDEVEWIKEIIVVVSTEELGYFTENVLRKFHWRKPIKVVEGGEERQHSVYNGLNAVGDDCEIVAIHDGARPLVSKEVILRAIKEAYIYKAAVVGVPVKDTIKMVDQDNFILDTPERRILWAVQTPQVFEKGLIIRAHKMAFEEGYVGTDDSVLVERMGVRVKMVEGDYKNIKITTPEDLVIAELFLKK